MCKDRDKPDIPETFLTRPQNMDDFCPRLHMKFILFDKICPTKSWNIGIKRNENNKQICQSQVKTPMFGEKFAL